MSPEQSFYNQLGKLAVGFVFRGTWVPLTVTHKDEEGTEPR